MIRGDIDHARQAISNTRRCIGAKHAPGGWPKRIATRTPSHTASADRSHTYVTHLLEDGFDHLFVQQQAGHSWGSTTAIYTSVGSDFKNTVLRRALDRAFAPEQPTNTR